MKRLCSDGYCILSIYNVLTSPRRKKDRRWVFRGETGYWEGTWGKPFFKKVLPKIKPVKHAPVNYYQKEQVR